MFGKNYWMGKREVQSVRVMVTRCPLSVLHKDPTCSRSLTAHHSVPHLHSSAFVGLIVKCILDQGSMGATISESLLPAELSGSVTILALVRDANGLGIPYLGYLEPDVEPQRERLFGNYYY